MKYSVDIDKNNLDEEAVQIPALFDMFQKEEAEWSAKWDDYKDLLSVVKADIGLKIRGWNLKEINTFFSLKLPKLTEDVYKNLVVIHPEVINLMNNIADARYNLDIYQAARKSIEMKAAKLDLLAKLHGQGYFMKVEGRGYKKFAADANVKEAARVIIQRIKQKTPRVKPSKTDTAIDL